MNGDKVPENVQNIRTVDEIKKELKAIFTAIARKDPLEALLMTTTISEVIGWMCGENAPASESIDRAMDESEKYEQKREEALVKKHIQEVKNIKPEDVN